MKKRHSTVGRNEYWHKLLKKYQQLNKRINTLKKNDELDNLSRFEKNTLLNKITKLFEKIKRFSKNVGVKVAGTALALVLVSSSLNAQTLTYKGVLKAQTPMVLNSGSPSVAFSDIDNDGNIELVSGNYGANISVFSHDNGVNFKADGNLSFDGLHDFDNFQTPSPDFMDFDGDGDADMFLGLKNGEILKYENNNNVFNIVDTVSVDGTKDFGDNATISFADLNGDGNEDLFIGNKNGDIMYAQNDGNNQFPVLDTLKDNTGSAINLGEAAPTLFDYDGDGHLDLFVGLSSGNIEYLLNDGNDAFTDQGKLMADGSIISAGSKAYSRWYDLDNDGTKDLIVAGSDQIFYYKNNSGTLNFADTLTSDQLSLDDYGGDIDFLDVDNDGDLDMIISDKNIQVFENNGNNLFTYKNNIKADGADIDFIGGLYPAFEDLDNNGDIDILVGSGDSLSVFTNSAGVYSYSGILNDNNGEIRISDAYPVFPNNSNSILYVASGDDSVYTYINNSGNFVYNGMLKIGLDTVRADRIAFSDINNDNTLDLIYTNTNNIQNYVYTATNNGMGVFSNIDTLKNQNGFLINFVYGGSFNFVDLDNDGVDEFYYYNNYKVDKYNSQFASGIKQIVPNIDFSKIYSNRSNIFVELKDVDKANVEIYDVSGKMILSQNLTNTRTKLNGFEKGFYIVKVYSEKGINSAKVVVE